MVRTSPRHTCSDALAMSGRKPAVGNLHYL